MDTLTPAQSWTARCAQADAAGAEGDWTVAARLWEALRGEYPEEAIVWRKTGEAYRQAGDLDRAEFLLDEAASRFPRDLWTVFEYTIIAQRRGDWDGALARAETMRARFVHSALGHVLIGEALRALGRHDEADAAFGEGVARFPRELWAHHHYAMLATDREQWTEALDRWQAMLREFPAHEPALAGRRRALQALGRPETDEAIAEPAAAEFTAAPGANRAPPRDDREQVVHEIERLGVEAMLPERLANPEVLIEITSICNFACEYCVSPMKLRDKTQMSMETFRRALEQIAEMTTNAVRLHVDGEPTTHPQFREMALLVNSYGLPVWLATNGSHLDPRFLDIWMDPLISMSTSAEELAERHKRLKFDRYIGRIADYVRAWSLSRSRQNIFFQIICYPQDTPEDDAAYLEQKNAFLEQFCRRAGLDESCTEETPIEDASYRLSRNAHPGHVTFLKQPVSIGGLYPIGGEFVERQRADAGFCDAPWRQLVLHSNGTLGACCVDLSGGTSFATAEEFASTPLKELWENHPQIVSIRRNFLEGRIERDVCQRCLHQCQVQFPEVSR